MLFRSSYVKTLSEITLEITRTGGECALDFEPALANLALVGRVEVNGRPATYDQQILAEHHHLRIKVALKEGKNVVRIPVTNDFGLSYALRLPELGSASSELRILSEKMEDVTAPMELVVEGRAGATYELAVWNPGMIVSAEGAELVKDATGSANLRIRFGGVDGQGYTQQKVTIHLQAPKSVRKKRAKQ